jgi:hypothetical protein
METCAAADAHHATTKSTLLPMLCIAHSLFHGVNYWILVDSITSTFVQCFYEVSRCVLRQGGSACDAWVSLSEIAEIAFFTKSRMEIYIPIVLERYVKVNAGFSYSIAIYKEICTLSSSE